MQSTPRQKSIFAGRTQFVVENNTPRFSSLPTAASLGLTFQSLLQRSVYYARGVFMGRRVSIEVPGFEHDNPIPAACRVGPFLITSGVSGKEPGTGKLPDGI